MLSEEFSKTYFKELMQFVDGEYQSKTVYPPKEAVFSAFNRCPFDAVKVVIIGQDPYHGVGQANGLSFSVKKGQRIPPSLRNIFKELHTDLGIDVPSHGDLSAWSKQGVLLLNATLTVEAASPGSHQKKGWETFTDAVIEQLNTNKEGVVYILWGAYAQKKGAIIHTEKNKVIVSAHPSPFAARKGFFGSKPFSTCNRYLADTNQTEIEWRLVNSTKLF